MTVGINYYIYYQLRPEAVGGHHEAFERLQLTLQRQLGLRGRLLQRTEDPLTRMEVYEQVIDPVAFESLLAMEVARHGLATALAPDSQRHMERFVACA